MTFGLVWQCIKTRGNSGIVQLCLMDGKDMFLGKYPFISYNLNYLVNLFDTEYVIFLHTKYVIFLNNTYNFFQYI